MGAKTILSLAEFERLPEPDGMRFELDEGELLVMTFPVPRHNEIVGNIYRILYAFVSRNALGKVFPSDTGYVLGRDPDTLRGPDVSFVSAKRVRDLDLDRNIEGGPDLAVEVVSASDTAVALNRKVQQYFRSGTHTVWVVYPDTKQVHVFTATGIRKLDAGQSIDAPELLPGFVAPVSAFFE